MDKWTFRLLCVLVFSIPIENMIVLPGVGTISKSIGMVVAAAAFFSVLKHQKIRNFGPVQNLFVVFLLWVIASFFWSRDLQLSIDSIKLFAKQGVFIWIIWEFAQHEDQQVKLMEAYVAGAFVPITSIIYSFIHGYQYSFFRYSAYGFDPNDIGLTIALGVPIAWYLGIAKERGMMAWVFRLYVPLAFLAITLTASRTSFVALMVATLFIITSITRLSLFGKVALFSLVLVSSFFLMKFVPSHSWERLMTIGSEISSGDFNSRLRIWEYGFQVFLDYPLFGTGIGAFKTAVESYIGSPVAPHNLFLSIMVELGIVGIFIFLAILIAAFLPIIRMTAINRKLWICVFLTWFVGVMALTWAHRKPTWFLISLLSVQGANHLRRAEKDYFSVTSGEN